jgi:choice-of-anchor B domain-containing protein
MHPAGWGGTDCWGWTGPDGSEYAFVGIVEGVGVVRTHPVIEYITTVPGPWGAGWRDIKTYENYMYQVADWTGPNAGLGVADLSGLPTSVNYLGSLPVDGGSAVASHNLSIDTSRGIAYVEGTGGTNTIHIWSLADPANPSYVSSFATQTAGGIHDMWAGDSRLYVAEGQSAAWSVWDMDNLLSPFMMLRVISPSSGYMHNIWPSEDHQYCVTTEETTDKTVKVWDISDFDDVQLIGEYLAPSRLAHNAHLEGDVLYLSHYESGVVAVSLADPSNPKEISRFDTYPQSEQPAFAGCWGVYPHTSTGRIFASNMDGTLFILSLLSEVSCAVSLTGDVNVSGEVSSADIIGLVNFIFKGQGAPSPCEASGDVDCNGTVTSSDIIGMVNYVFKGGTAPCDVCDMIPGTWSCP